MASFHTKTFAVQDNYYTPKSAWEAIQDYIPLQAVIWEGFTGNGHSAEFLRDLGFEVISNEEDFFENNHGDIVVTNPPFSKKRQVFQRLKELDKPFIVIAPVSMIVTKYFRETFENGEIQIIIPRRRIQFLNDDENGNPIRINKCNFDCFYYCYKMNLPNDITWLK
jgi:hypothetical protein